MNRSFLFFSVAILFFASAFASRGKESIPEYYVSKNNIDNSLPKTEAVFTFQFSDAGTAQAIKEAIKMSYNGINATAGRDKEGKFSLKVKPGKYLFKFYYNDKYLEITTDSILIKPSYRSEVHVNFHSSIYPVICDKPVIYVYPEKNTEVSIKLDLKGKLNFTYPQYNNGWNFVADTNGTISMNNKKFNYLFWEGQTDINADKLKMNEGFVVQKENLVSFFEEKLSVMGLNSKEIADYVTYWCPLMNANEKNYVHFMFNDEFSEYAPLTITPKPDNIFRVFMLWSKATGNEKVSEQKIESFSRKGFTVLEWGGTNLMTNGENLILH